MQTRNIILIVDDMASNRLFLKRIFEDQYDTLEADDGEKAIQLLDLYHDKVVAVLLDVIMPGKDGYWTLKEAGRRGYLRQFPVLVITANRSTKSEARALELGASDLIIKPYDPFILRNRTTNLIELFRERQALEAQVDELSQTVSLANDSVITTLASVTESRSLESGQHILRIRTFTKILLENIADAFPAYQLDKQTINTISDAAVLHDVGKISIPDAILNKPGRLTKEEFDIMKTHTTAGCHILENITGIADQDYMRYAYNICRYHHERWDGHGYPDGLKGDNIPICAQAVSIADVYDALTTPRVYKPPFTCQEAVNMILNGECGAFNPELLECFKNVQDEFAACAKDYADGKLVASTSNIHLAPVNPVTMNVGLSTQQMSNAKYQAMLKIVDGIVIELDMDTGIYHTVYDTDGTFDLLHKGHNFEEVIQVLLKTVVHPDDRERATRHVAELANNFFEDGLRRQVCRYRVRSNPQTEYFEVEASFLRVDTKNPNERKVLVVWQKLNSLRPSGELTVNALEHEKSIISNMMGMVIYCRVDNWITIMNGHDRVAKALGYTPEEVEEQFHNRLIEMVVPEDRDILLQNRHGQLQKGSFAELEYRLRKKDGGVVWVLDKNRTALGEDGTEYDLRFLVDNTSIKEEETALREAVERYKLLMNQKNDIIFEWDIERDVASFSSNFEKLFGYDAGSFSMQDENALRLHPDDMENVRDAMSRITGESALNLDFRLQRQDETYRWCRLRAAVHQKENGRIGSVVGVLTDINEERQAVQALQERADQDSLTKLYNRDAARMHIDNYLAARAGGDQAAMLILDMDNFKQLNNTYGHMAGDSILIATANALRRAVRDNDIVARSGGDEFLVFLKNIPGQSLVKQRANLLLKTFETEISNRAPDCKLSCSIGISMLPEDGDTVQELLVKANKALRIAKERGKNQYVFYNINEDTLTDYIERNTRIDSNETPGIADQSLVTYALNQLYHSGNVEETIQNILAMLGQQMNVSRVYIFENNHDNTCTSNTFEWVNTDISAEMDNLQNLSYEEDLPGWWDNYNDAGVFYCRDVKELPQKQREVLEPQGIRSMLQCALWEDGRYCGFLGFDECVLDRLWTQEQIDLLQSVAKILSLFLLKRKEQSVTANWAENLLHVIISAKEWLYVIDPDTCEVVYFNESIAEQVPQLAKGHKCYQDIMGRDSQCPNCPARNVRRMGRQKSQMTCDSLNLSFTAEASLFTWDGEEAALIVCNQFKALEHRELTGSLSGAQ